MTRLVYSQDKIIAIVGPTATGKSALAIRLAKKLGGEIISADSRQVYRGLDIGTGKPPGKWETATFHGRKKRIYFISRGIRHHVLDFMDPRKTYSAGEFVRDANAAIVEIQKRRKITILCGGTGFWIDALLTPTILPGVAANPPLRAELAKLSASELFAKLQNLDPHRAARVDSHNRRRIIRAIEIALMRQALPSPESAANYRLQTTNYELLFLGLTLTNLQLKKAIRERFRSWLGRGLVAETKKVTQIIDRSRLKEIGMEYPVVALFLEHKITRVEMIERSVNTIYHYAKRQKTWFKKNSEIHWVKNTLQAERLAKRFLDGATRVNTRGTLHTRLR